MQYSFMSFSCPQLSFDEMLTLAKRFGYAGIEPRVESQHKHGVEYDAPAAVRKELRRKSAQSGVAIACLATSCCLADLKTAAAALEKMRQAIDLAGDIGARRVRIFGGGLPAGISREQAIEAVAGALRAVAEQAKKRKVIVCLETHDDWCDPSHVAEVMRRVNHPAIGVNWDIMHPVVRKLATMEQAFDTLKPWIRHVHFHDGAMEADKVVLKPVGQGMIDHRCAVRLLRELPYQDFLSGEWIGWEPYEIHLPRELAAMRRLENEPA